MALKVIGAGFGRPDTDFPHLNDNEATKEILNKIMKEGFEAVFGYNGG